MANTFITNDIVTKGILTELKNNLIMGMMCNRHWEPEFSNNVGPVGNTINIRQPTRYTADEGPTLSTAQDITQRSVPLTLSYRDGVRVAISSQDRKSKLDDFTKTITRPIAIALANKIDQRIINAGRLNLNKFVGTPGTPINTFNTVNEAAGKLTLFGVAMEDRYLALNVKDYVALTNSLQNSFNEPLNKGISANAQMRRLAGFDVYQDQNLTTQTPGAYVGTPLVNGANQSGSTLVTDGWTGSVTGLLKAGDHFTIAGCYAVNAHNVDTSLGELMQFVVTEDVNSTAGAATIPFAPAIVLTGPYKNVLAAPADNAEITVLGTASTPYKESFAWQREAFTLAVVPLPRNETAAYSQTVSDEDLKLSLRMTGFYDGTNDIENYRVDVWYGVGVFPDYGTLVVS